MAFFEHYTNAATGDNTNGGSSEGAPVFSLTNGDWNATTGVFTATGSDLSAIMAGMSGSIMLDGATVGVFVSRVLSVDDTADTITFSLTAKSGTAPTTGATGRTVKVGGAWKGPNGAVDFPFDFVESTLTNAAGNSPRINYKNNATYGITATMAADKSNIITHRGYSAAVGDGGQAIFDGGNPGTSFVLLSVTGADLVFEDFIFRNNGTSGSANGVSASGNLRPIFRRIVAHGIRGSGIAGPTSGSGIILESEAYDCNKSNSGTLAGITGFAWIVRCFSHDNLGNINAGFFSNNAFTSYIGCIAARNGRWGIDLTPAGNEHFVVMHCDLYANVGNGLNISTSADATFIVENNNFVKNGGYGWLISGSPTGFIHNNGYGSGTQANTSGQSSGSGAFEEIGSVTYPADVTPWVDPANGDFRVSLPQAKGQGRGQYTQTAAGYAGTVGYPDIGSAQSKAASNNTSLVLM